MAQALIDSSAPTAELNLKQLDDLCLIVDYGWLSDTTLTSKSMLRPAESGSLAIFDDFPSPLGIGLANATSSFPPLFDEPINQDWWADMNYIGSGNP